MQETPDLIFDFTVFNQFLLLLPGETGRKYSHAIHYNIGTQSINNYEMNIIVEDV